MKRVLLIILLHLSLFFEKIGDKNSTREEKLQNLIKILKANGWKIKGGSNGDS